jgi:hypothetical protein
VNWFRQHIKTVSRLALFALAIQFSLSFGHFHGAAAQAAPAIQTGLTDAAIAAQEAASEAARQKRPADHDSDNKLADCAICAVIALANNFLLASPPLLELPRAIEHPYLTTDAGFSHLGAHHWAFQSRAPPAS